MLKVLEQNIYLSLSNKNQFILMGDKNNNEVLHIYNYLFIKLEITLYIHDHALQHLLTRYAVNSIIIIEVYQYIYVTNPLHF